MPGTVEAPLRSAGWAAFGTSVVLRVVEADGLPQARSIVEGELEAIDRACSRFREDSELSAVNARPGERVRVSPLFEEALALALRGAAITGGTLDPTVGLDLARAGYDRDWRLIAADPRSPLPCGGADDGGSPTPRFDALSARRVGRWEKVELNRALGAVTIPVQTGLDLGSTAKAWAADRGACAAARSTGCGVLLSIGGDIACVGAPPPEGWLVRVTDDHRGALDAPGQTIRLSSGGLATSSTSTRRWRKDGREMHHIIDPLTGVPASSPWRTVSVAAEFCADANIAATATLAMSDGGEDWLRGTRLPARLVDHQGMVLTLGGWPSPAEQSR